MSLVKSNSEKKRKRKEKWNKKKKCQSITALRGKIYKSATAIQEKRTDFLSFRSREHRFCLFSSSSSFFFELLYRHLLFNSSHLVERILYFIEFISENYPTMELYVGIWHFLLHFCAQSVCLSMFQSMYLANRKAKA